ncbi:MAG: hypothetical protein R6U31_03805 [bacterium]
MDRGKLLQEALRLKKADDYIGAIKVLGNVLESDRFDSEAYYSLGKIYYLLDDRFAAVKHYLVSLHLDILEMDSTEKSGADALVKDIPEKVRKQFDSVDSSAKYTLLLKNHLRHIAHALNDLSGASFPEREHIDTYRQSLKGEAEMKESMNRIEDEFYFPLGAEFSINSLDFGLPRREIVRQYFTLDENLLKERFADIFSNYIKERTGGSDINQGN